MDLILNIDKVLLIIMIWSLFSSLRLAHLRREDKYENLRLAAFILSFVGTAICSILLQQFNPH